MTKGTLPPIFAAGYFTERLLRGDKPDDGLLSKTASFWVLLPMPPSLNNIYATVGKRRVKIESYTAWQEQSAWVIAKEVSPRDFRIGGPVNVEIDLPHKMRGDIDNRVKPILDALVASGRIDDDRNVVSLHVTKGRQASDVLVTVSAASILGRAG